MFLWCNIVLYSILFFLLLCPDNLPQIGLFLNFPPPFENVPLEGVFLFYHKEIYYVSFLAFFHTASPDVLYFYTPT